MLRMGVTVLISLIGTTCLCFPAQAASVKCQEGKLASIATQQQHEYFMIGFLPEDRSEDSPTYIFVRVIGNPNFQVN